MKQIVLASILAIALVPALSFAENNDMQEPPTNGSGAVQNNHEQHNDMQGVPPMGSGAMMGSGMGMSGAMMHEDHDKNDHQKGPMGSGEIMKHEMDGLRGAMEKLTPRQYTELAKMIRTYLESKGIQVPTPEVKKGEGERKGWDGSIKGNKNPIEIKAQREILKAKIKAQREIMQAKIKALKEKQKEYTGHVTLMK